MKLPLLLVFFLFLQLQMVFSSVEIEKYINQCEFMLYSPSLENVINTSKSLLKRFYGKNYDQKVAQISSDSKSLYGIDIFDLKNLVSSGLDIKNPVSYVHVSNKSGYLLIPVTSKKIVENYVKNNLSESMFYKFIGNYICLSENKQLVDGIEQTAMLEKNEGFTISSGKLNFNWDKNFVWVESRYLSSVSASLGVSSNFKIPYGFTALTLDFLEKSISLKSYSGILSEDQNQFIRNMRNVAANEKNNLVNYIWGNPAVIGNFYLNIPAVYKYYNYIDTINILGIKGFISELQEKYKINVEKDLISNSDGRLKIIVDKFDAVNNDYVLYGSMGIKSIETANSFMDSLKSVITQNENKLYSFELFSKPFYHYKSTNYSVYYGVVENDLIFSTDKDILIKLVKNIYENKSGYMGNMPPFFRDSITDKKIGYFIVIDAQSFFNNVKTGIEISKDFLIGVKEIHIYGNPDLDDKPYGWNTSIDMIFYN